MNAIVREFEHSLALPFFGIGMKTDFSSPVATAEFSKFAGNIECMVCSKWKSILLTFEIILGIG